MDELNSPYGLEFDDTQQLVLASSELFRLSHDLNRCHDGLETAISTRVKGETKRKRYDQMKVSLSLLYFVGSVFDLATVVPTGQTAPVPPDSLLVQYAGQRWIILVARWRLREKMKLQVRKRAQIAKHVGLLEHRSAGLVEVSGSCRF